MCKPCISLHKDLDSDRENGKATSGNKNVLVRSSYFLKKPSEEYGKENKSDIYKNGDDKLENVVSNHAYEPLSALTEQTCKKEKRGSVQSSFFRPSMEQNSNGQIDNVVEKYSFKTHRSDVDDDGGESETTAKYTKHRVRSTFFGETSVNENYQSKDTAIRSITNESHSSSLGSLSTNNSLECRVKKRKIPQSESPRV